MDCISGRPRLRLGATFCFERRLCSRPAGHFAAASTGTGRPVPVPVPVLDFFPGPWPPGGEAPPGALRAPENGWKMLFSAEITPKTAVPAPFSRKHPCSPTFLASGRPRKRDEIRGFGGGNFFFALNSHSKCHFPVLTPVTSPSYVSFPRNINNSLERTLKTGAEDPNCSNPRD